jgi:hypothetical protein
MLLIVHSKKPTVAKVFNMIALVRIVLPRLKALGPFVYSFLQSSN